MITVGRKGSGGYGEEGSGGMERREVGVWRGGKDTPRLQEHCPIPLVCIQLSASLTNSPAPMGSAYQLYTSVTVTITVGTAAMKSCAVRCSDHTHMPCTIHDDLCMCRQDCSE